MLTSALALNAEALIGYWDGTVNLPALPQRTPWDRLVALQQDARDLVLDREGSALFSVAMTGAVPSICTAAGPVVTLIPPDAATLAGQMVELRAAMDLRADRLPEILAQQGDMLSFFGAQQSLGGDRRRWTLQLIHALYGALVQQEMWIKHACSVARPVDLSAQIQPIIQTPAHSAFPSGHATEAFAFATVIAALRLSPAAAAEGVPVGSKLDALLQPGADSAVDADAALLLFRLAARIADNRTVAGVHYPVDSAAGALLGLTVTRAFIAHCEGGGAARPVPTWTADGSGWSGDFTLAKWLAALGSDEHGFKRGEAIAMAAPMDWHLLPTLWAMAVREWA